MKKINRSMFFSILVVLAYVLSACSGAQAVPSSNSQSSQPGQVQEVVFTGTVDSMGGGEWTISGQAVSVDGTTAVDASIVVGSNVKVEARVDQAHTLGLGHSDLLSDVMSPIGTTEIFSDREVLLMKLMYQRPAGNTFPDNDRNTSGLSSPRVRAIVCRR